MCRGWVLENPQTKDISMVKSNDKILDVGVDSISKYTKILRACQTIFWNGPLGYVEKLHMTREHQKLLK